MLLHYQISPQIEISAKVLNVSEIRILPEIDQLVEYVEHRFGDTQVSDSIRRSRISSDVRE